MNKKLSMKDVFNKFYSFAECNNLSPELMESIFWCGVSSADRFLSDEDMRINNKSYFDYSKFNSEKINVSELKHAMHNYLKLNKDMDANSEDIVDELVGIALSQQLIRRKKSISNINTSA